MQRFTRFTFSTHVVPKLPVLVICSRLSAPQLFQHWVVHFKIVPKVSLQLRSCLVPRRFVGFSPVVAAQQDMGRTKNKKRPSLFTWSFPLCPCVFEASYDPCVVSTVENLKKRLERTSHSWSKSATLPPFQLISANSPRGRTKKPWLWLAGSNQNATNTTNQIPRLSSVRVRQTNNDCAQTYFSLCSPFSILRRLSFFLGLQSFLS